MSRGIRLALYSALAGGVLALLLVVATPVGPWLGTRLLGRLAAGEGWQLTVSEHAGSLLGGFSLEGIAAAGDAAGVQVDAERLEVSLWARQVKLVGPRIRIALSEEGEEEAEPAAETELLRLPVESLPELILERGEVRVEWTDSESRLEIEGAEAHYRTVADTLGQLTANLPLVLLVEEGREAVRAALAARIGLGPASVAIDSLGVEAEMDTLGLKAGMRGRLALVPGLPMTLQLESSAQTRSTALRADLDVDAAGRLEPLAVQIGLAGQVRQPQLNTVELGGRIAATPGRVEIDSLEIGLLGGRLEMQGEYYPEADSAAARVRIRRVDWAGLAGGVKAGPADGELRAAVNLQEQRYDVDLELLLHQVELLSGQPLDIRLEGFHRADRQTRVALSSAPLELVASGWVDPAALPAVGSYDLALAGTLQPESLIGLEAAPVQISGRVRPDSLQVHLRTPHLPGQIGAEFGELALDLEVWDNRILEASLALEQQLLRLHMRMDLAEGRVDTLVSSLSPFALDRLVPGLQGSVRGQVRAAGTLDANDLRLASQFEMPGAAYGDWRTGPVTLRLDYRDRMATCALEGSGLKIETRVDTALNLVTRAVFDGALLYNKEDSTAFREAASLTGTFAWQGNLNRPHRGRGRLDLQEVALRQGDWEVRTLSPLAVEYRDQDLLFEQVELQTPLGPLKVAGSTRADSLALSLAMPALDLRQVASWMDAEGEGALRLEGTLQRPRATGRIDLRQVLLDTLALGDVRVDLALEDSLELQIALFQNDAEIPAAELMLSAPAAPLIHGISAATGGAATLRFAARQADLTPLLTRALAQPARGRLALEGTLSAPLSRLAASPGWRDLRGEVVFSGLDLATEMEGDSLRLEMAPAGRVELADEQLELRDLQVRLTRYDRDARRFLPAGKLALEGNLQGGSDSQLTLSLEKMDLLTFHGPEGTADLRARIGGTLRQPAIGVDLEVETEDLGTVRGRLAGDGDGARLWTNWTTPLADSLVVRGELPWNWERGEVDYERGGLRIYAERIGLSFLSDLVAQYEIDRLGGQVDADLRIDGLGENMSIDGSVGVQELELALIDAKPAYVFPTGRLVFAGRRGEFVDFVSPANKDNGRMALSGQVDLSTLDDPRFALRLETEALVFRYEDIFAAPEIDMDLTFEGSLTSSRVAGSVRLEDALVEPVLVAFDAPPVPPPPPALRDEFLENMALQVVVDIRDLQVDSELAKAQVSGGVDIGGTFYKPIFQGDIEIDDGQVFILNREFEFQRGRIVLNSLVPTRSILDVAYDPLVLDPELDMVATCTVVDYDDGEEYDVSLNVQGTALNPAPEFTSEPARGFNDIFRLLAFGSISSQQVEFGAALGTAAGQLLSKQVEKVGLDEFTVLPSSTVIGSEPGHPALRIGKYFDEIPFPVWVRYESTIRDMSAGEVRLEHRLKSYLTLSGTAQSRIDRYGLGIGLKKEY